MGSNGKWSHLSCETAPNGDITFAGSRLGSDDVTVNVSGIAHQGKYSLKAEGQWTVSDHQGVIVSGNTTTGAVKERYDFGDPELTLENTQMMVHRAAKVCESRQGKPHFRPAKMDFNLF